jgi:ABC-type amino acid transport substrate-binding protein
MKKILCIIALVSFFYIVKKIRNPEIKKNVVIGMMNGYPPYMDITSDGNQQGFDVDIVKGIEKELGVSIEIKDLGNLSTLFLALENESIDAVMSGLDITTERAKNYDIIYYHGEKNDKAYIVSLNNTINENNLVTFHWRIAAEPGSSNEAILKKKTNVTIISLQTYTEMMMHLKNKTIDGFLLDVSQIERFKSINDKELSFFEIKIPDQLFTNGIGIACKKGSPLKDKLQEAITKLIENGTIKKDAEKWGLLK